MAFRSLFLALSCSLIAATPALAVTVYGQYPLQTTAAADSTASGAASAAAAAYTGSAAYDPTTLQPPPLPNPPPATEFAINLMPSADMVTGISIETPASFFGISIEMSVANQVSE